MTDTCIICGRPAASGDYIFPGSPGLRKTSESIYCRYHSNQFNALAKTVNKALEPLSSLLATSTDQDGLAKPLLYTSPDGRQATISNSGIGPMLDMADSGDASDVGTNFGGQEGLRSIAYMALTFLAHYRPNAARDEGTSVIKDFLVEGTPNSFVWSEPDEVANKFMGGGFEFGHVVAIITSEAGPLRAFVSLYGAFHFGVELGTAGGLRDETIVTYLDPQVLSGPLDGRVDMAPYVNATLRKPDNIESHSESVIGADYCHKRFEDLLGRIEKWQFRKETASALVRLNASRSRAASDRHRIVTQEIIKLIDYVFKLMQFVVRDYAEHNSTGPGAEFVVPRLRKMVSSDAEGKALSPEGRRAMTMAIAAISKDVKDRLSKTKIGADDLWAILHGGHGASIVGEKMFELVKSSLLN